MRVRTLAVLAAGAMALAMALAWGARASASEQSALDEEEAGQRAAKAPAARRAAPEGSAPAAARPVRPEAREEPRPVVLRFTNISAESFMGTLKQLGENEAIGERLREIPIALNGEANAVVVIAPPKTIAFLQTIARGLDQPNEFRENRRRQMEERSQGMMQEMRGRMEEPMGQMPPRMQQPMRGRMGGQRQEMGQGARGQMQGNREEMQQPMRGRIEERMGQMPPRMQQPMRGRMGPGERPGSEAAPGRKAPVAPAVLESPAAFFLIQDQGAAQPPPAASQSVRISGTSDGRNTTVLSASDSSGSSSASEPGGTVATMWGTLGEDGSGALRLLQDEGIRGELAMTPDQVTLIGNLLKDRETAEAQFRESQRGTFNREELQSLPPEERKARMAEALRAAAAAWQAHAEDMAGLDRVAWQALTDTQRAKLREINVSSTRARLRQGIYSMFGEQAVKELALSNEQVDKINAIIQQSAQEAAGLFREKMAALKDLPPDQQKQQMSAMFEEARAKAEEMRATVKGRIMEILTPDQQKVADKYMNEAQAGRGKTIGRTVRPKEDDAAPAPAPAPAPAQPGAGVVPAPVPVIG